MICRSFLLVLYALGPIPRCISAVLNPSAAPNASAVPNPSAVPNASAVPNPSAPPSPTGALPFLGPSGNWSTVVANNCTGCSVKLDPTQVVDQILHDTTGTTCSITLNFTGTAIYFFSAANTNPLVNLTFSLDGAFAGTSNIPDSTTQIPSVPMFSKDGLSNETHTLVAQAQSSILLLFDFATHTFDDGKGTGIAPAILLSTRLCSASTSVSRTSVIPSRARTSVIPSSGRTFVIPSSTRTFVIPSSERASVIPSRARTSVLHSSARTSVIPSSASTSAIPSSASTSVTPSSAITALPATEIHHSLQSITRAELGSSLGGAIGLVALLAAAAAPGPAVDAGFDFVFTFPLPIKFRGKMLQDAQITIVLQPAHLTLTNKKPESGFTLAGSTSTSHEPVAWKVLTLFARQEGQSVRLPRDLGFGDVEDSGGKLANSFFNFAPLRTLVTRTTSTAWRSARFIIPGLAAMVVANNAAPEPVDFALGTYHAKKDEMNHNFYPFVVVRGVLNSQFCVAPQCEELVVNAYITQNIDERQLLTGLFDSANSDTNHPIPDRTSDTQKEPNAAPRPTIEEDDEDDRSPKILSGALIGDNGEGRLVSTLEQKTKWHLVADSQDLRLKIVSDAEA